MRRAKERKAGVVPSFTSPLSKNKKIKVRGLKTPSAALLLYYCPPPPPLLPIPNPPSKYVMIMPAMMAIATTIING